MAVLLVYGSHLLTVLPIEIPKALEHIGRAGVMLFFVHTCLVLLMSLDRTPLEGWALGRNFYIRRAFRIYPLSIVAICCVVAFHVPWMPSDSYTPVSAGSFFANITLTQNLFHIPDIIGPLWSLPWEVQMYLALPVVFLIVRNSRWNGIAWGLWAGTVAVRIFGAATHTRALSLLGYAPCFLAGAIIWRAACVNGVKPRLHSAWWPVAILVATLIHTVVRTLVANEAVSMFAAGYLTCIFLAPVTPLVRELPNSLLTTSAKYVAKYSYGIYLAHLPLMWVVHVPLSGAPGFVRWGFLALSSVTVPVLLFHFVEDPMIKVGKRVASRFFAENPKAMRAAA